MDPVDNLIPFHQNDEASAVEKFNLIVKDLSEIVGCNTLKIIIEKKLNLKVYWGTAPTGRVHFGYFKALLKIAELISAGCEMTILIADLHAMLDSLKSTDKQIEARSVYYEKIIRSMLYILKVDVSKVRFVRGTSFQLSPKYVLDMHKLNSLTSFKTAQHAGAEVVKNANDPNLGSLTYPGMQSLDEEYLGVDAQLGGKDQRKIFMYARDMLPKLGYKKRIHFMTPMIPGLRCIKRVEEIRVKTDDANDTDANNTDAFVAVADSANNTYAITDEDIKNKMSASNESSKIDVLDTFNQIKKKIGAAYCLEGDVEDNSLLELLQGIIFPLHLHMNQSFSVNRDEKYGGNINFKTFEDVKVLFQAMELHPSDLKVAISNSINSFLVLVRRDFETDETKKLLKIAYG